MAKKKSKQKADTPQVADRLRKRAERAGQPFLGVMQ